MKVSLSKLLFLSICSIFLEINYPLQAQIRDQNKVDTYYDTLLIINGELVKEDKILMLRQDFIKNDTLRVNQKGLQVESFQLQALSLGTNVSLSSNEPLLTEDMINLIINDKIKYKFIYLKNIILRSKDGRALAPTFDSIKVVFTN